MTHEQIIDLVDSNGTHAKIIQETHHIHQDAMLTRILVQKHILQMRKEALDGVHTPFRSLPH